MQNTQPTIQDARTDAPRLAKAEVADLLALALLRLRGRASGQLHGADMRQRATVGLGFSGDQRVNGNPNEVIGVRL